MILNFLSMALGCFISFTVVVVVRAQPNAQGKLKTILSAL